MSTQIQRRRGTTAEHSTFTGVEGELTVDTTKDTAVVHDGTTVGGHPLQKQYPPLGSAAAPTYTFTGDTNTGIYSPGADQVAVATNGTGRLFVDASGNIGHKSTPASWDPDSGLSAIQLNGYGAIWNYYNNVQLAFNTYQSSTGDKYLTTDEAAKYTLDSGGNHVWYTASSGSANAAVTFSERVRITNAGLVGIGTSSPATLLHIAASGDPELRIQATGTAASDDVRLVLKTTKGEFLIQNDRSIGTSGLLTFNGAANDYLCIDHATGNVGIATTSPITKLEITGANEEDLLFLSTGNTPGNTFAQIRGDNEAGIRIKGGGSYEGGTIELGGGLRNTDPGIIKFSTGTSSSTSTERARIDSSGRLLVGTSNSASTGPYAQYAFLQVKGNTSNTASSAVFNLQRGEGAATITTGESLGLIDFTDNVGNSFGVIACTADGTAGAGDFPGRLVFSTTADGASSPTERMRITSDAYVRLASGTGGIQFNGDTAAANALDDYEEGTWTPGQGTGVTVVGAFSSVGRYTKTGRVVHYEGYMSGATSVAFNPAGGNLVTGLPFTIVSGSGTNGNAKNGVNTGYILLSAGGTVVEGSASISATGTIYFSGQYIT
jgi:hypothetical protein